MTSYLLATASVHVTAAAADYLRDRLDPATDDVIVVGVNEPTDDGAQDRETARRPPGSSTDRAVRDAADAANVARSRLVSVTPTVDHREGDPLAELRAAVEEYDPDVVVIGSHAGTAASSGLGSTATALLTDLDRPIVVVEPTA